MIGGWVSKTDNESNPELLTARYSGTLLGCFSSAMRASAKSQSREVWCSQRFLVMACALPPNLRSPNT